MPPWEEIRGPSLPSVLPSTSCRQQLHADLPHVCPVYYTFVSVTSDPRRMAAPGQLGLLLSSQNVPQGQPGGDKGFYLLLFLLFGAPQPQPPTPTDRACPAPWRPLPAASWDAASCFPTIQPKLRRFQIQLPCHHIALKESDGVLIRLPPQIKLSAS